MLDFRLVHNNKFTGGTVTTSLTQDDGSKPVYVDKQRKLPCMRRFPAARAPAPPHVGERIERKPVARRQLTKSFRSHSLLPTKHRTSSYHVVSHPKTNQNGAIPHLRYAMPQRYSDKRL